jgi:hypothetical protein
MFRTGAAIYTAVVVARSTGPNRQNCEFRILLRSFEATALKRVKASVAQNFGENRPGCFTMTVLHLTLPSSPSSLWRNTKWLSSPTHRNPLIWHPVTSYYFQK